MLDEKNQIIYEYLLADARFPIKKLAAITSSSKASIINRIEKLEKQGYISRYDAIINWQKLPFIKKVYHIKVENEEESSKFFEKQEPVFSIIGLAGLYNLQVWCFFKTKKQNLEFEKLIKGSDYISVDIERLEFPRVSFFNKPVKLPLPKIKDRRLYLDKIDVRIIKYLSSGSARDSLLKISEKLKIPYDTVHYRFKRLLSSGYFLRLVAQPGENAFTLQTTVLYIRTEKNIDLERLYQTISKVDQIISIAKTKDNGLLIHFNSLTFEGYQNKLNEIFSTEKREKLSLVLLSHWKKILLNNRYPLEFLLR